MPVQRDAPLRRLGASEGNGYGKNRIRTDSLQLWRSVGYGEFVIQLFLVFEGPALEALVQNPSNIGGSLPAA
jgi:hypothetical protein